MPIEIKELLIKAVVTDGESRSNFKNNEILRENERMKKDIVMECIEEVLQKLEEKTER